MKVALLAFIMLTFTSKKLRAANIYRESLSPIAFDIPEVGKFVIKNSLRIIIQIMTNISIPYPVGVPP